MIKIIVFSDPRAMKCNHGVIYTGRVSGDCTVGQAALWRAPVFRRHRAGDRMPPLEMEPRGHLPSPQQTCPARSGYRADRPDVRCVPFQSDRNLQVPPKHPGERRFGVTECSRHTRGRKNSPVKQGQGQPQPRRSQATRVGPQSHTWVRQPAGHVKTEGNGRSLGCQRNVQKNNSVLRVERKLFPLCPKMTNLFDFDFNPVLGNTFL